ncbi:MAG: Hsp20/alpha crystallin family protein, partial [Saprospiraceae bacterium]|nr:Hsp20/alpha crystallin family protein [Saprospiraceae bacterium]
MCNRQAHFIRKMHKHGYGGYTFKNFHKKLDRWEKDPPANVEELDDKYVLYVYAPGFEKSDFKVSIKDETLVIHAKQDREEDNEGRWRR